MSMLWYARCRAARLPVFEGFDIRYRPLANQFQLDTLCRSGCDMWFPAGAGESAVGSQSTVIAVESRTVD